MMQPVQNSNAAELPMNCQVLETDKTHLNREEHALLTELLRPGASIEAVIPSSASPDELWRTLEACVRGLSLLEARMCRLKPIIGKILLIFEQKPSLYKSLGYETYSDFMKDGVSDKLGLGRSNLYQGKLVARDWPQIGPDRYAKLGPKRIDLLAKAGIKGTNSNAEEWLKTAESMKVSELTTYMEQRGFLTKGEGIGATIMIQTNRMVYDHYKNFFASGRVHSVVGSKDPGEILEAMIQECEGSWIEMDERTSRAKAKEACV